MGNLSPVKTKDFRKLLKHLGLNKISGTGHHEKWSKQDLIRPVIFQAKFKELPVFILRNNLRTLGLTDDEYIDIMDSL